MVKSPKKGAASKAGKAAPKKEKASESAVDANKKKGRPAGEKKKGGAFTKEIQLSPELAALVGANAMARQEVVKKVWAIIKEKNLYDPENKQFAICDAALLKVIGVKRFRTFGMMKYLKNHFIS